MERMREAEPEIVDFVAVGNGVIHLKYMNGLWVENDLSDLIAIGGIYARLADDEYLAQARIGDYGHWIEWPGEVDIGADTLWEDGVPVETPGLALAAPAEPVAVR